MTSEVISPPLGHLIDPEGIAVLPGLVVGGADQVRVIGIADAGEDDADDAGGAAAQVLGQDAGGIAPGVDDLLHLLAGGLPDAGGVIDDAGHRGGGDARLPGDIIDGCLFVIHGHAPFPCAQGMLPAAALPRRAGRFSRARFFRTASRAGIRPFPLNRGILS